MVDHAKFLTSVADSVLAMDRAYRIVFWNDELVRTAKGQRLSVTCSVTVNEGLLLYQLPPEQAVTSAQPKGDSPRLSAREQEVLRVLVKSPRTCREGACPPPFSGVQRASAGDKPPPYDFVRRPEEVLRLLAVGTGLPQIAESLGITGSTVRNHVQNILRRLGVHSRLDAVLFAQKNGLLPLRLESGE